MLPHVRGGGSRPMRSCPRPLAAAPAIPTADEAGVPGVHISVWTGLWAPKDTPKDIVAKVNAAVVEALADPAVRKRIAELGFDIPPRDQHTPEALATYPKGEIEKWWPIIKAAKSRRNESEPCPDPSSRPSPARRATTRRSRTAP